MGTTENRPVGVRVVNLGSVPLGRTENRSVDVRVGSMVRVPLGKRKTEAIGVGSVVHVRLGKTANREGPMGGRCVHIPKILKKLSRKVLYKFC